MTRKERGRSQYSLDSRDIGVPMIQVCQHVSKSDEVLRSADRNQEATVIHSVPSASDEIHSMDHQLTSILDPFLHLPIKLSRDEMAMLQFSK